MVIFSFFIVLVFSKSGKDEVEAKKTQRLHAGSFVTQAGWAWGSWKVCVCSAQPHPRGLGGWGGTWARSSGGEWETPIVKLEEGRVGMT